MKGSANPKGQDIAVRVSLPDDDRARRASLAAYAFSQGGKLLNARRLQVKAETTVRVPFGAEGTNVRLVVGPPLEGEARSLAELARRGAVERQVRVDLDAGCLMVDTVTLPWRAKYKNGFATFSFQTKRVAQVVFATLTTPVGLAGNHSTTQNAQALMDANMPPGCLPSGCDTATFTSFEYVTAHATDGWTRLRYLDSSDFEAFTLRGAT